jgi:hypothetical protein
MFRKLLINITVFILFILGISLLIEWLIEHTKRKSLNKNQIYNKYIDDKINNVINELSKEIKELYILKINEKLNLNSNTITNSNTNSIMNNTSNMNTEIDNVINTHYNNSGPILCKHNINSHNIPIPGSLLHHTYNTGTGTHTDTDTKSSIKKNCCPKETFQPNLSYEKRNELTDYSTFFEKVNLDNKYHSISNEKTIWNPTVFTQDNKYILTSTENTRQPTISTSPGGSAPDNFYGTVLSFDYDKDYINKLKPHTIDEVQPLDPLDDTHFNYYESLK